MLDMRRVAVLFGWGFVKGQWCGNAVDLRIGSILRSLPKGSDILVASCSFL